MTMSQEARRTLRLQAAMLLVTLLVLVLVLVVNGLWGGGVQ